MNRKVVLVRETELKILPCAPRYQHIDFNGAFLLRAINSGSLSSPSLEIILLYFMSQHALPSNCLSLLVYPPPPPQKKVCVLV